MTQDNLQFLFELTLIQFQQSIWPFLTQMTKPRKRRRILAMILREGQVKYLYNQQCPTPRLISNLWLLHLINLPIHATSIFSNAVRSLLKLVRNMDPFSPTIFRNWNSYKHLFPCKSIPDIQIVIMCCTYHNITVLVVWAQFSGSDQYSRPISNSMQKTLVKWAPEPNWLASEPIQHSKSMTNTQNNKGIKAYSLSDEVCNPISIALIVFY